MKDEKFDMLFNKLFKKVDEPDLSGDQKYVRKLLIEKVDDKHPTHSWVHIGEIIGEIDFSLAKYTNEFTKQISKEMLLYSAIFKK